MYLFCLFQNYFSIVSAMDIITYLFIKYCSRNLTNIFIHGYRKVYAFLFYNQYVMITKYLRKK